jgi:predicted dehydrogenase
MKRRDFVKHSSLLSAGALAIPAFGSLGFEELRVRVGVIGMGMRGRSLLELLLKRTDTDVVGICDIDSEAIAKSQAMIKKNGKKAAAEFVGPEDWKTMLENVAMDAVIIATPWRYHAPMAKAAMKRGCYAGVEVPAALTLEDCFELVQVSEETGMPCMMLENVCYRRDVMAILNMVRKDMFGELVHMECGYQHDLRHVKFNDGVNPYGGGVKFGDEGYSEARWRTVHALHRNGDFYPTHGIGPVAQMLDINKGNRFVSLSSFSSKSRGLNNYVKAVGGADHPNANLDWKLGDVVTTLLKTSNDETITIQHDTNLPRPYSLGFRVQGTKGLWMDVNDSLHIEGLSPEHRWEPAQPHLDEHDHPLWKKYGGDAEGAGHGGMDWFVVNGFIEACKRKVQTPIDVYDSATWSAIIELSEQSIATGNMPMEFPDFTGGSWVFKKSEFARSDDY